MAHNGYSEQQRPYRGNAAQPPTPRGYEEQPQQPYGASQGNGNGYDNGQGGAQQDDYFGQYNEMSDYNAGPARPPPGRGRPPPGPSPASRGPPPGRGGHPPRGGMPAPRGRGMPGPGPGRGMPPAGYGRGNGPYDGRGPDPRSRGPPPNQRDHLSDRMASMDINRQQDQGGYGYAQQDPAYNRSPPPRGPPQQAFPPRGAASLGYSQDDQNLGYGRQEAPRDNFGPPSRSVTMPVAKNPADQGGQYNGPTGNQPYGAIAGAQNMHAGHDAHNTHNANSNYSEPYPHQSPSVANDIYDAYFDSPRHSGQEQQQQPYVQPQMNQKQPNFQDYPPPASQPGYGSEQARPGAHQIPQLNDARSMASIGEPQAAVFEMAGDTPSVPPLSEDNGYKTGYDHSYSQSVSYAQSNAYNNVVPPPRGPSAPPAQMRRPTPASYGSNPSISRPATSVSHRSATSDSSHPVPVRPGQIPNSLVNPNDRPAPVRNYGGIPQSYQAPPQPPQPPQQPQQPPYPQQQPQQNFGQPTAPPPAINQIEIPEAKEQPVTTQELEQLRMSIKNNPNDQLTALKLAKRLIEASTVLVPNVADARSRAKAGERYLTDAYKVLKKLSSAQNQDAMFILADSLGRGLFGNEPDGKEAFTLYQSAAKLGHAGAAYRTAVCCEIGNDDGGGTRKDPLKAMQWYKRAAMLGDVPAMYKIGMILLKGLLGQNRNPREAVGWLKRAAERADTDNPHALHELGLLYESARPDDSIVRDEGYALSLFQQAADLGYKFSQYRLGCAYEFGLLGCPIDPRLSIVWYSKAAMQEEHQSELALSGWYLTGSDGVLNQSDTEAYLWARKAAVAGLPKAEYAMGYFTEVGIGIQPNLEDAKRWYWRAAAQDFPKARERLEDLKRMGKNAIPRQRERFSRSRMDRQEGDCVIM